MKDKAFVFNDTETTGLNTWFSQIIQIGSVLTDSEFNVDEELNISSKVLPWVVPTKGAYETHKQVENLSDGMSHYEMMHFLKDKWLNWGKSKELVHVTYNGMSFDEELFRRQFYWNLIDPYLTTNRNGSSRIDLMVILFIIANFYQEKINMPKDEDGNIRYKLGMVAEANGISSLNAHDAVVDCYLMINLVRLINKVAPEVWQSAIQASSKKGLIVFGQGSGHGVGMSQWGAKYLASRGQKAERILKHFYRVCRLSLLEKITYRSYLALRTNFGFILDSSLFKKPIPSNVCFLSITLMGFLKSKNSLTS